MKTEFKLKGLSKPRSFTCHTDKGNIFWAKSTMAFDRFDALFDFYKGEWKEEKRVLIEHDGFREDGTPINPLVLELLT